MAMQMAQQVYCDGRMWGRNDFCPERPAYEEGCEELLRVVVGGSQRRVVLARIGDIFESRLLLWDGEGNGHVFASDQHTTEREALKAIHELVGETFEPTSWGYDLSTDEQAERDKVSAFLETLGYTELSPDLVRSLHDHPDYKTLKKKWGRLDEKLFSVPLQEHDTANHKLSAYCYRTLVPILHISVAEYIGRAHLLGRERMTLSRVSRFCAAGRRILELGCGEGVTAAWIATSQPTARVLAVDQFKPAVALTRAKTRRLGLLNLRARVADVFDLAADKAQRGSFDRIVVRHVIGHSAVNYGFRPFLKRQLTRKLKQLRTLLAPHGRLFFALSMTKPTVEWTVNHLRDCLDEGGYIVHTITATPFRYQDEFEPYSHLELIAARDEPE